MSSLHNRVRVALCLTALAMTPALALSQTQPQQQAQMTPQMRSDIAAGMSYTLPTDFLPRARAAVQALQAAGIQPPNSTGMGLSQTVNAMNQVPGLKDILAQHGFDAHSFVLGMTAFGMTLSATNGQQLPPDIPKPNPTNVALFHAHPQEVTALMEAMGAPPGSSNQQ